jgi:hypothetical protein
MNTRLNYCTHITSLGIRGGNLLFSRWLRPRQAAVSAPDSTFEYVELRAKCDALSTELAEMRELCERTTNSSVRSADPALFPRALGPRLQNLTFLLIGTCQVQHLAVAAKDFGHEAAHFLYRSREHDEIPIVESSNYDAAIVGLTLRRILQEAIGRSMDVAHVLDFWTSEKAEVTLGRLAEILDDRVTRFHTALNALPIFFLSFVEPSFSYEGNLISSEQPSDLRVFIRKLNGLFGAAAMKHPNCYLFDINQCLNMVGRAHFCDDIVTHFTHNSIIANWDDVHDTDRIVPFTSNWTTFDVYRNLLMLNEIIFTQLSDNIKTLRQTDAVKLIVVDLDDTLWRGTAAEDNIETVPRDEGWPLGFVEVLRSAAGYSRFAARMIRSPQRSASSASGAIASGSTTSFQ